jgi:hypothetical protein
MISEIGAGQKICLQARYEKAQDADPTTTICGMPVVRTATFDPKLSVMSVPLREVQLGIEGKYRRCLSGGKIHLL